MGTCNFNTLDLTPGLIKVCPFFLILVLFRAILRSDSPLVEIPAAK
jgi:hypothetical protein